MENNKPIDVDDILDSLVAAIEAIPERKDNRSDPILEPHLKLVSIVHKLVHRGVLKASILLMNRQVEDFLTV